jgi:hypothetical protein
MPDIPRGTTVIDLREGAKRISGAWNALLGRRFGPGLPLSPTTGQEEQTQGPRQYQYPVGVNTNFIPRRDGTAGTLTPFEQLRNLAALYDVAAMCIATRIEEMQGLEWAVVPKDKKRQEELQDECDAATDFMQQPDKLNKFDAWLGMLLYDLFSIDAPSIYKRLDRAGRLHALEIIDGSTIKPLLDERGRAVAYQQILYGSPASQYRREGTDAPDEELPIYAPHELIYRPRWTRTFTPYGFPPTEWIILRVNTALRKQAFDLAYFTDGNIPDMIATPPGDAKNGGNLSPEQVEQFEEWFNAMLEGNDAARRKVRFLPWNMNMKELRPFNYETILDEWMLRVTCAAYSVPPQELGFTNDVNKGTAELQEAVNQRKGLKPLANWLKKNFFNDFIQQDLAAAWGPGRPDQALSLPGQPTRPPTNPFKLVEWGWQFGDDDDKQTQAATDQIYHAIGAVSANEIRVMRFGDILDGDGPGALGITTTTPAPEEPTPHQVRDATPEPADAPPAEDAVQPAPPVAARPPEVDSRLALNGAQVQAALDIMTQVQAGQLGYEAARNALQIFFNLSPEQAERLLAAGADGLTVTEKLAKASTANGLGDDDPLIAVKGEQAEALKGKLLEYFGGLQQRIESDPPRSGGDNAT